MATDDEPEFDRDLWVEVDGVPGRLFILGNPHTFPGRFSMWSDELRETLYVSKSEIAAASNVARLWVDAYLHGNEPTLAEYLGISPLAADKLEDDDAGVERWRAALEHFHSTGEMPILSPVPTLALPVEKVHGHRPWTWAGGQVWVWQDDSWQVARPQPRLEGTMLAGSLCADRGHDELEGVGDNHVVCIDCGGTTEIVNE